jgi:hypothetical protein
MAGQGNGRRGLPALPLMMLMSCGRLAPIHCPVRAPRRDGYHPAAAHDKRHPWPALRQTYGGLDDLSGAFGAL